MKDELPSKLKPADEDAKVVLEFMFRLGQAYIGCGEQTATVELLLRRIANAYGLRRTRVVAFPTAIFISAQDGEEERITLAEGPTQTLRLDQISDVYELGLVAQRGEITPRAGLERLTAILRTTARYGMVGAIFGYMILAVGLALVLMPSAINIIAAATLGLIVGAIKASNRNRPVLSVPMPVVAATIVSALVFLALKYGFPVEPLHALVPPLVAFLPGSMLTLGMVELAYGDMVSGSSRLITGWVQLVLLLFGLAAGASLVGYSSENLVETTKDSIMVLPEAWAPWAGVVVFGIGAFLHFSAPQHSLWWMLLVLLLAFGAQQLTIGLFGKGGSGFFGMLVATPLGYLIQLKFKGPPAMVTFLPTFWLLVPGAMGLISLKRMLSDRVAGMDSLVTVVFALTSIALGTLVGASLYKWLTERFGWWQLQISRVGTYFSSRNKK